MAEIGLSVRSGKAARDTSRPVRPTHQGSVPGGPGPAAAVTLTVPVELIEAIAERAAAIVLPRLSKETCAGPYLVGWAAAAAYVGVAVSTLKHSSDVPRRKIGGCVLFRRDELDGWVDCRFEGATRFHHGSIAIEHRFSRRVF